MNSENIVQDLINGASLCTEMIPDASIPSNRPKHLEGFNLPNIIIDGDVFWGMGRAVHCSSRIGEFLLREPACFCYSNGPNGLFISMTPVTKGVSLMPIERYEHHRFFVKNDYHLIWDSLAYTDIEPVKQAVMQGLRLKSVLMDNDNLWNIHPVDLTMFYLEESGFALKTELFHYPYFLRDSLEMQKVIGLFNAHKKMHSKDKVASMRTEFYPSFYCCFPDGLYCNYFDVTRDTRKTYKQLRIFAEGV